MESVYQNFDDYYRACVRPSEMMELRLEYLSARQLVFDTIDGSLMRVASRDRGLDRRLRHWLLASSGMTVEQAMELWNSL